MFVRNFGGRCILGEIKHFLLQDKTKLLDHFNRLSDCLIIFSVDAACKKSSCMLISYFRFGLFFI